MTVPEGAVICVVGSFLDRCTWEGLGGFKGVLSENEDLGFHFARGSSALGKH